MANFNLDKTLAVAREDFQKKEPELMALHCGGAYEGERNMIKLIFLDEEYEVKYPEGLISSSTGKEIPINIQVLILHYLINATGQPLSGKYISFKELPNGAIYIEPFTKRTIAPLVKIFADRLEDFFTVAAKVGGRKETLGDASVTINLFPRVPITYVIWGADDEFPANGNVLFDSTAPYFLPTEDYAVAASHVVWELKKLL